MLGPTESPFARTHGLLSQGLKVYAEQLKVATQNLSSAQATASTPGGLPYSRQSLVIGTTFDKNLGTQVPKVKSVLQDTKNYIRQYKPDHPAADDTGFVLMPNIHPLEEIANAKEAIYAHGRLLKVYKQTTQLQHQTIGILK